MPIKSSIIEKFFFLLLQEEIIIIEIIINSKIDKIYFTAKWQKLRTYSKAPLMEQNIVVQYHLIIIIKIDLSVREASVLSFHLSFLPSLLPSSLFLECHSFMPFCFVVNTVCRNNILKWRHILKMNIYIYNNCGFAIAMLFVIVSSSINFIFNYLKNNNLFLQHQESKFAFTHELTFFIFIFSIFISIRASTSLTPG